MRVLVAYGSERGGTQGIAETIRDVLRERGLEAEACSAESVGTPNGYDAVMVGGALYMFRWNAEARKFVKRNAGSLRSIPVWLFSSGPLDDTATQGEIPPIKAVMKLMQRVAARGHQTFGGRLASDAKGFMAQGMAKKSSGDWRDTQQIQRWANDIADELVGVAETKHAASSAE